MVRSPEISEVEGKVFGNLTIRDVYKTEKNKYFICSCKCGNIIKRSWYDIMRRPNKFCNNCRTAPTVKTKGEAAFNRLLRVYKDAAKIRNISWKLTKEQFRNLTSSNCHYCGEPPVQEVGGLKNKKGEYRLNGQYYHNGVDRRDPNESYTISNCVPCCKYCNLGKNDQSYEEYLLRIEKIYDNLVKER